jgi:hypothetical protein
MKKFISKKFGVIENPRKEYIAPVEPLTYEQLKKLTEEEKRRRIEELVNFAEISGKCRKVESDLDDTNQMKQDVKVIGKKDKKRRNCLFGNNPEDY